MAIEVMLRVDLAGALRSSMDNLCRARKDVKVAWLRTRADLDVLVGSSAPVRVGVLSSGEPALLEAAEVLSSRPPGAGARLHWVWLANWAEAPAAPRWLLQGGAQTQVVEPADDRELAARVATLADAAASTRLLVRSGPALRVHGDARGPVTAPGAVLLQGTDATVLSCGAQVGESLAAAMDLQAQSIRLRVISLPSLAPLAGDLVQHVATEPGPLLVAEPGGAEEPLLARAVQDFLRKAAPGAAALGEGKSDGVHRVTRVTRRREGSPASEADPDIDGVPVRGPSARDIQVAVMAAIRSRADGDHSARGRRG